MTKANNQPSTQNLFKFFWFFYKTHFTLVIFYISIGAALGFSNTFASYFSKLIIDNLSQQNITPQIIKNIKWILAALISAYIANHIFWRINSIIMLKLAPIIKNNIISYSFNYIHKQSLNFFQDNLSGSIAHNISTLADSLERLAYHNTTQCVRGLFQLVATLVVMYFVHPVFSIALLTWAVLFVTFNIIILKRYRALVYDFAFSVSSSSGKIVDSIANFASVKIFAKSSYELSYLKYALEIVRQKFNRKEWFLTKIMMCQGISIDLLLLFMWSMLIKLKLDGLVTIGDFVLISSMTYHVTENIWFISEVIGQINEAIGKSKQSLKMLFTPIEINDKPDAKKIIVTKGEIIFNKVHFQYKDNPSIFKDKSIIIPSGQKLGLVGYSGSGKSTFVNLILRLYDIQSGAILIDGQDIRDVTQESLHQNIGMIPQDPSLFHRTLMNNIRYANINATENEVIEAAKKARAHDFILKLKLGYQSLVGERGTKLSGGQRQRIAIARAILKNAPILILDEATSALDSVTEGQIQDSLNELMSGKTVIVIAHRLSTLLHMDRILVFDNGKIVEDGSHVKLLEQNGRYKELWDAQSNGFLPQKKEVE